MLVVLDPVSLLGDALDDALASAGPRTADAMRCLLRRVVVHRNQQTDAGVYVELAVGYVAKAVECGYATAYDAWGRVRRVVGWSTIGASTREGEPRPRYHDQRDVVPGCQGRVSSGDVAVSSILAARASSWQLGETKTDGTLRGHVNTGPEQRAT